MSSDYHEVRLTRPAALGNGTREAGETICRIVLAPGVELNEALTALRNLQICSFIGSGSGESEVSAAEPAGEPFAISLAESRIPVEYHRPLIGAGIQTVQDLLAFRARQPLTAIDGIGRKSAEAIEAALT